MELPCDVLRQLLSSLGSRDQRTCMLTCIHWYQSLISIRTSSWKECSTSILISIRVGTLELYQLLLDEAHNPRHVLRSLQARWDKSMMSKCLIAAARFGRLDMLRWTVANMGCSESPRTLSEVAAIGGHVDVLEWIGVHDDMGDVVRAAAQHGQLRALVWLHEHTEMEYALVTSISVRCGHAHILGWISQFCTLPRDLVHQSVSHWLAGITNMDAVTRTLTYLSEHRRDTQDWEIELDVDDETVPLITELMRCVGSTVGLVPRVMVYEFSDPIDDPEYSTDDLYAFNDSTDDTEEPIDNWYA